MANVVAMAYCAIQGYANGNTTKMWRGVDKDSAVCGYPGGAA